MRTSNPALSDKIFSGVRPVDPSDVMTLDGTVNKTIISILITTAAAYWSYSNPTIARLYIPFLIAALVMSFVIYFYKKASPILVPMYAVIEGCAIGTLSFMANLAYPGVVFQALSLTLATLLALLMAYKSGWIRASENFKLGVTAATGAIFVTYLISFVMSLFGINVSFIHSSSPLSIGISVVVVIVAALNLVLDFDFIENASARGNSPKYMEWFGAFGLLVTLIWLYVEILRLLMKLNDRR